MVKESKEDNHGESSVGKEAGSSGGAGVGFDSIQRLEKAFDKIESVFAERLDQLNVSSKESDVEVVLANLDILITRVKDILLQVEKTKNQ